MTRAGLILGAILGLAVWPGLVAGPPPAAAPADQPFAAGAGWFVVVLDGRDVSRDTCRAVAKLLAPVRATVTNARPPHMRPGDYLECRCGPLDWAPGRSGWANVLLSDRTPRYTPQVVYAGRADPKVIAHEVAHTLLGFGHHPDSANLMHDPPGESWTWPQVVAGRAARNAYANATPEQFRWRLPAGWAAEPATAAK